VDDLTSRDAATIMIFLSRYIPINIHDKQPHARVISELTYKLLTHWMGVLCK